MIHLLAPGSDRLPVTHEQLNGLLEGAIMMASFTVAVFFLRYWRATGERLFAAFAFAFTLFGVNRIELYLVVHHHHPDAAIWVYASRLAGFAAIIAAVLDKNLSTPRRRPATQPPAEPVGDVLSWETDSDDEPRTPARTPNGR
jgi:hypothetical protein